ncbi:MAG: dienelactone hydrolase family protein [Phycisphaerales bacterium]
MVIREDPHIDISTPTGPMRTYLYRPAAPGRYPGVVFFSEIFQVTGPIRRQAAILAGHGFVVAVPEIFHDLETPGCVLAYDTPGADRGNADKVGKPVAAYDDDARAAVAALAAHDGCTGKVGVMGICIGGHLSFRAAMNPAVQAGVCFYATDIHTGSLGKGGDDTLARIRAGELRCEMFMAWGRQDPHIPHEGRRLIYDTMSAANANFSWLEFNAAHAFLRDEGARYNPELARQCYGLVADMLRRRLAEGDTGGPVVQ